MSQFNYLIHIQYLGYRFHGWAKQPEMKTVQGVVEKAIAFVLGHNDFKTLGTSRTDSKVSANHMAFELFLKAPIQYNLFLSDLNKNLPSDIRILDIKEVDESFNIIQSPKIKEYLYLFSSGEKAHPFSASLVANFPYKLNIELMNEGARIFEGRHNFKNYCKNIAADSQYKREVLVSRIEINKIYTASFFPEKTYAYHIHAKGFLRYQIRMMMGQLVLLGKGDLGPEKLKKSLEKDVDDKVKYIAPAAGLILNRIRYTSTKP